MQFKMRRFLSGPASQWITGKHHVPSSTHAHLHWPQLEQVVDFHRSAPFVSGYRRRRRRRKDSASNHWLTSAILYSTIFICNNPLYHFNFFAKLTLHIFSSNRNLSLLLLSWAGWRECRLSLNHFEALEFPMRISDDTLNSVEWLRELQRRAHSFPSITRPTPFSIASFAICAIECDCLFIIFHAHIKMIDITVIVVFIVMHFCSELGTAWRFFRSIFCFLHVLVRYVVRGGGHEKIDRIVCVECFSLQLWEFRRM